MAGVLERRQFERRDADVYAVVRNEPVINAARILDVSAGGMRLKDVGGVRKGSEIAVQLIGGEIFEGRIAWVREHEVGLQFRHPLDPEHRLLRGGVRY